jgi:hypothetical protein
MRRREAIIANSSPLGRRGFTLFEIFLALLILAVAIIPMMNAFAPALLSGSQEEEQVVLTGAARSTLNRLLDLDFSVLDAHRADPANLVDLLYYKEPGQTEAEAMAEAAVEAAKETVSYRGQTYIPAIAIIDASGGAGGILELRVSLQTVGLRTLKANR